MSLLKKIIALPFKTAAGKKLDEYLARRFHRRHLYKVLKRREDNYNAKLRAFVTHTTLTPEQRRQVDELWRPYMPKVDYSTHEYILEKTGRFEPTMFPAGFYYCHVDKFFNDWDMALFLDNKCLYPKIFKGIPLPHSVCFRMNKLWFDGEYNPVSEQDAVRLMQAERECFIKVARDSYCGKGIVYVNIAEHGSSQELEQILHEHDADVVIQRGLTQSAFERSLNPTSVNTLRVLSLLKRDGEVKIYSRVQRMGAGGAKVDNLFHGGATVGVQPDGRFNAVGYDLEGNSLPEHPTSHTRFDGLVLPALDKAEALVRKAHHCIPYFRLCSWDVAFDEHDEPVLIEANMQHGGQTLHILNNGPLFGDDLPLILEEVFGKKQ